MRNINILTFIIVPGFNVPLIKANKKNNFKPPQLFFSIDTLLERDI